jgi:hypothetical protein
MRAVGPQGPRRRWLRRRQAPMHWRDVVRSRGDFSWRGFGLPKYRAGATWSDAVVIFPGEVLAFQNIERQAHALRAPAPGAVVETPPAAAPDPGEDDFEGGRMSGHFTCGACGRLATPCRRGQIDESTGAPRARWALGGRRLLGHSRRGVGTPCEHSSAPSPRCRRDGTPGPAAAPRRDVWRGMNRRRWAIRRG